MVAIMVATREFIVLGLVEVWRVFRTIRNECCMCESVGESDWFGKMQNRIVST